MPSLVDLALVLATAQVAAPAGDGPRATSGEAARYDRVGYAADAEIANGVAHASLPVGSAVEVTALDSGRTVVLPVRATAAAAAGNVVALSARARLALGAEGRRVPVRIRAVTPSPQDEAALRSGAGVAPRLDAPPVLLVGLRKQLPVAGPAAGVAAAPPAVSRAGPARPAATTVPARAGGWLVQVATLSDAGRARALAHDMNGSAVAAGKLWRVQLGPFTNRAGAQSAQAEAAERGFRDARILRSN